MSVNLDGTDKMALFLLGNILSLLLLTLIFLNGIVIFGNTFR
jgi:hypothetical protein